LQESNQIIDERYKTVRALGEGAFGVTYLAKDLHTLEFCVVKIARLNDEAGANRLQKEARALAKISGSNAVLALCCSVLKL
jgi:serine/threonine protein kinase